MKTRSKYICWTFVSAHHVAGMFENISLTKTTCFPLDILTRKTREYCVLTGESLRVSWRQTERAYDHFQVFTRPRNAIIPEITGESIRISDKSDMLVKTSGSLENHQQYPNCSYQLVALSPWRYR